jgi:hypothetical protein
VCSESIVMQTCGDVSEWLSLARRAGNRNVTKTPTGIWARKSSKRAAVVFVVVETVVGVVSAVVAAWASTA